MRKSKTETHKMYPNATAYNRNRCNPRIWKRFSTNQRRVYNYTYDMVNQKIMTHPDAPKHTQKQWKTVRHNAGCIAAWSLDVVKV